MLAFLRHSVLDGSGDFPLGGSRALELPTKAADFGECFVEGEGVSGPILLGELGELVEDTSKLLRGGRGVQEVALAGLGVGGLDLRGAEPRDSVGGRPGRS